MGGQEEGGHRALGHQPCNTDAGYAHGTEQDHAEHEGQARDGPLDHCHPARPPPDPGKAQIDGIHAVRKDSQREQTQEPLSFRGIRRPKETQHHRGQDQDAGHDRDLEPDQQGQHSAGVVRHRIPLRSAFDHQRRRHVDGDKLERVGDRPRDVEVGARAGADLDEDEQGQQSGGGAYCQ